ncbi:uncharacterized protein [Montipora capricornis]|uniref:uncharacterized protein n=1 Tax=Montipora capricornis TaxID=246305 RepID=UPI0035F11BE7
MKILIASCVFIVTTIDVVYCRNPSPAKLLFRQDHQTKKFVLQGDALAELEQLKAPVRVIGAIGDSRVGKSTNLNFIRHFLDQNRYEHAEKVFRTSDEMEPCTSGVWISTVRDSRGTGSTVLVDTEGTNLGNDDDTDLLSIFTVLMSSGLALFVNKGVMNHNRHFLYRVSRLSEQMWPGLSTKSFPELKIILRGALSPSPGKTLYQETQDFILNNKDGFGETIGRQFPRNRLSVAEIPYVAEPNRLNDLEKFASDKYAGIASSLAENFKRFPVKKTINGGIMDGKMLADLALKLQDSINRNCWEGFADTYLAMETSLCDRVFREVLEPLLSKGLDDINASKEQKLLEFFQNCTLEKERTKALDKVSEVVRQKADMKAREQRLEEQRKERERQERINEERAKKRLREAVERQQAIEREKAAKELAERQNKDEQKRLEKAKEQQRALEREQARQRSRRRRERDFIGAVAGVAGLAFLSDSRLKENITLLPYSEYETIGLHSFSWVWSKAAEGLGKSGCDQGLIAQDVEKLYPWAVGTGPDGYKRVNYKALIQMMSLNSGSRRSESRSQS